MFTIGHSSVDQHFIIDETFHTQNATVGLMKKI